MAIYVIEIENAHTVSVVQFYNGILSAETVFRRQNLTSIDVRLGRSQAVPALEELTKIYWFIT